MKTIALTILAVTALVSSRAQAQDSPLAFTVGARAWYTDWTTFSYYPGKENVPNVALTQVSAQAKLVVLPTASVRWNDFFASVSGMPSARFSFDDGTDGRRSEFDVNAGYRVMPSLAVTLGYKKVSQSGSAGRYRPAGPVIGASANAPLGNGVSVYGSLAIGRLHTPSGDDIRFKANYQLAEVGLAYALTADRPRWTLTGGYRIQTMRSKDALLDPDGRELDGRDTTQGVTLGVNATF